MQGLQHLLLQSEMEPGVHQTEKQNVISAMVLDNQNLMIHTKMYCICISFRYNIISSKICSWVHEPVNLENCSVTNKTLTACPISDNKHARPPTIFSSPLLRAGRSRTSLMKCTLHNKTWGSPYERKHNCS